MESIVQITLKETEVLQKVKIRTTAKPHFNMIGTGRTFMDNKRLPAVDLLYEMSIMTKKESYAFLALRNAITYDTYSRSYNLYIPMVQTDMTPYQKKLFQSGITLLIKKDLVRRVKRGIYLINPMAIVPNKDFDLAEQIWSRSAG